MPAVYQFQNLDSFNLTSVCFCCYVVSSISSPFRRLHQADHIAEGKARPQHRGELRALRFLNNVWDLTFGGSVAQRLGRLP